VLYDAIASRDFCRALLDLLSTQNHLDGKSGQLEAMHTSELGKIVAENNGPLEPAAARADQSHSSIIFGEKLILKIFRRLNYGINPDLEILKLLTAQKFPHALQLAGALEYRNGKGEASTVAILTSFVPKAKDAWEYTMDSLGKFYERVETLPPAERAPQMPAADVTKLAAAELSEPAKNLLGTYMESARLIGGRTAAMHLALSAEIENFGFIAEPFTQHAQRGVFESMRNRTRQNFQLLNRRLKTFPPEVQAQAQQVLILEPEILKKFRQIYERQLNATRIREHGDYHLGQLLYTGKDFLITDFEGDPAVSISERRLKRSPLQDVASMIRSFHQVAYAALLDHLERGAPVNGQSQPMALWARFWARWVSAIFFKAYLQAAGQAAFLPPAESDLHMMTEVFLLRKAVYELGCELANRPDWVKIPLQGILELMSEQNTAPSGTREEINKASK
jgi:maltose alpha-D-glucosyltransferase / alpha-amylase